MKKVSLIFSSALLAMLISSCGGGAVYTEAIETEATDGNQEWMTENLNVDKFRNGDPIPEAKTDEEWRMAGENKQPAWCYYDNDPANGEKYGKLYNWYAVNDPRGLAPEGWHIPSDEEWDVLTSYHGGEKVAGEKMKSTSGWNEYGNGENGNGTNSSGFTGLPGGGRSNDGNHNFVGEFGSWWSSEEEDVAKAMYRSLKNDYDGVYGRYGISKKGGLSVRCLRD